MDNQIYQELALRTAATGKSNSTADMIITGHQAQLVLAALGLCGEAGEVAEMVKKHVFHGHELDFTKCVREAGDVQWYLNYFAVKCCGSSLDEVMEQNIAKLSARYPEGFFTIDRSLHRAKGDT